MEHHPYNLISLAARVREKANQWLMSRLEQEGITGLAPSHGDLLVALFKNERLTMGDLAVLIDRDKSTVTALVDKLTRLGLVDRERDSADGRIVWVQATPQAKALIPAFQALGRDFWEVVYRGFTPEERNTLASLLGRVNENLR
ncbi:MAG: MarR family transcriptional regulator [Deltaproteobacteria bacterium]|nr:MarR family transcriptional regulator [Deltaproteobacteria bacterium]